MYGSQLWDTTNPTVEKVYVQWRKAHRQVLELPYRTHCDLLPLLYDNMPLTPLPPDFNMTYARTSKVGHFSAFWPCSITRIKYDVRAYVVIPDLSSLGKTVRSCQKLYNHYNGAPHKESLNNMKYWKIFLKHKLGIEVDLMIRL